MLTNVSYGCIVYEDEGTGVCLLYRVMKDGRTSCNYNQCISLTSVRQEGRNASVKLLGKVG